MHVEQSSKIEELLLSNYPRALQNQSNKHKEGAAHYNLNTQGNNFLENLLKEANELHSSDIHIETYGEKCRIRFRVDGILIDRHQLNRRDYRRLSIRLK